MKTLAEAFAFGRIQLNEAGIEEANLDAWLLLEYVTGVTRSSYYMNSDKEIADKEYEQYAECIKKRVGRVPLQHITGKTEFMGLEFFVNENVLCPRQDTEVLVEHAMARVKDKDILDLCTGSGCIAISLAKLGHAKHVVAVDISDQALEVARRNISNQNAEITLLKSDLFQELKGQKFDVIVSNPPYIPTKDIEELMPEVKDHEPMLALDGMEDGLYFYRKIASQAKEYLKPDGEIFMEIGYDQGPDLISILEENTFTNVKVFKDLAGLDRVVYGKCQG